MAASRNASTANTNNGASTAPLRISFAKIKEPLEVPNLLALQTEKLLTGSSANAAWKARVEAALDSGQDVPTKSGLEEIFEEISPIEDFSGSDVA
ncbi:DNA-directed RNA polymerase subunit beta [Streptomyces badius]